MAEMVKKKSSRVEQRGRFTITELEPESPASSANGEPHSYVQDGDGAVHHEHSAHDNGETDGCDGASGRASLTGDTAAVPAPKPSERISPFGSAVFERSNGVVRAPDGETANGETTDIVVSGTETAVGDGETTSEHGDRRVKRKGRFTIIELSSDSPRSRRNSAEEFSTTTSISVTSTQVSQANAQNLSTSPTSSGLFFSSSHGAGTISVSTESASGSAVFSRAVSESTAMNSRTSRSVVGVSGESTVSRGRSGNYRRGSSSRMRSVSPVRDRANHNGYQSNQQQHHLSASYGSTSVRPQSYNASPLIKAAQPPSSHVAAVDALASSFSSVSGMSGTEKPPAPVELGSNRRHLASRQKAITISAEQFIQQQQTIASLIRQQQELKQLIGVLQEQQHHLMSIPMPINEFMLDQAHSNAQEDTMREVQIQVTTLSRANDALQSLLSQAEQDAHERTMEIECLSDENSVIRHRYMKLEQKYHDERKHSLKLEHELVATRRALNSRLRNEQNGHSIQKQQHKLSRNNSRRLDDPIEPEPAIQKSV